MASRRRMRRELAAMGLATRPVAVYEQLVARIRERELASGIHLLSLRTAPEGTDGGAILYMRDGDVDAVRTALPQAVAQLHEELHLPDLFAVPGRAMRVERVVGWQRWTRSTVYQEHFRRVHSARQFVVGLTDAAGCPRAFMAVSRDEWEPDMTVGDEATITSLRDEVQRALVAFDVTEDWSRPVEAILRDLALGLPIPTLLMDVEGRIIWMNGEAEVRLGLVAYTFGSTRFYGGAGALVAELGDWVRLELDQPGGALERAGLRRPSWLRPEEQLVVKRVGPHDGARVLICVYAPTPPVGRVALPAPSVGLSAREAEVAMYAARGFTALNIAARLNVAESTIKTHLKRVYKKLGVYSRVELTRKLIYG